jgi:hypothetical protein
MRKLGTEHRCARRIFADPGSVMLIVGVVCLTTLIEKNASLIKNETHLPERYQEKVGSSE